MSGMVVIDLTAEQMGEPDAPPTIDLTAEPDVDEILEVCASVSGLLCLCGQGFDRTAAAA